VPSIEFIANAIGRAKLVDAPEGGDLVDLCDRVFGPVPFSCRSATCGTCHVEVLEGQELLEPPGEKERELLQVLRARPNERLACQARSLPGQGRIRVRAILGG
jgi:ferredoxin